MRLPAILLLGLFVCGCRGGGLHRKGERMASVQMQGTAWPFKGHALAWLGEESHSYLGGGFFNHWFVSDRTALGAGLMYNNYQFDGRNVASGEIQGNYRHFFFEHEDKYSYFLELFGGAQWGETEIPRGATRHEYTFGFGPGMEVKISDKYRLLAGAQFHHQSNALGRTAENNPSQNDLRLWVAFGWMW